MWRWCTLVTLVYACEVATLGALLSSYHFNPSDLQTCLPFLVHSSRLNERVPEVCICNLHDSSCRLGLSVVLTNIVLISVIHSGGSCQTICKYYSMLHSCQTICKWWLSKVTFIIAPVVCRCYSVSSLIKFGWSQVKKFLKKKSPVDWRWNLSWYHPHPD